MPRAKKPVAETWWSKWRGAVIASGSVVGALVVIGSFIHPVTESFIGDPPFASRSALADMAKAETLAQVNEKTENALQFLQQNTVSNAQDWYERYRRDVINLSIILRKNPNNAQAQSDLEFATSRRDFYKAQIERSEKSNYELQQLIAPNVTGMKQFKAK